VPTPAGAVPPVAVLTAQPPTGAPNEGSLGTYTWGGDGSDAPWIVPPAAVEVDVGTRLDVSLDPSLTPVSWTARWAPVTGDTVGDVASSQEGSAAPSLRAPDAVGTWSLQLEARFGQGHSAVWYWRIEVRR
jgi:hypothetical protein